MAYYSRANQVPAGDDGHMMVWKCENGECTHDIPIGSLSPVLRVLWVRNSKLRASSQSLLLLGCQDGSIHLYRMDLQAPIVRVLNLRCKHSIVDSGIFSSHMATNLSGQRKHIVIQ